MHDLGQLVITPGVSRALMGLALHNATEPDVEKVVQPVNWLGETLGKFLNGDWGDMDAYDKKANDKALASGGRLMGVYLLPDGTKVWVITEADRSVTTLLLPEEY